MPNFSKGKYNQHENRGRYQQDPSIRKVSFKNNQGRKNFRGNRRGGQGRGFENQIRDYFINEDFSNEDFQPGPSYNNHRGGNRGGGNQYHAGPTMPFKTSATGWYKCTVAKASKYEKNYIIDLITEYVKPYEFEYYNFLKIDGETYSFFVSNFDLAEKLYLSRGRIKTVTNHTLVLFVGSGTPYIEMTSETKEKIKLVMAKRYNGDNNALDLSKFYADPDFLKANIFTPLDRSNVMTC
ncbi:hypothetical protein WDU94_007804, partial [Cyamophila willieti]